MKSFTHYRQTGNMDCGPTCLRMIAKHYGKHYSAQTLREKAQLSREGVSMLGIAEAAELIGLRSVGVKLPLEKVIADCPLPCVLHWGQNHFVVLYHIDRPTMMGRQWAVNHQKLGQIWGGRNQTSDLDPVTMEALSHGFSDFSLDKTATRSNVERTEIFHIADPAKGLVKYTYAEFERKWLAGDTDGRKEGLALLLEPTPQFFQEEGEEIKGLQIGQLLGYLWRYKKLVVQLGLTLLTGSALSLLFPFLTQSVVDIGITTQNTSFINLILIAQLVLLLSTAAVDFLRSWILLHISTRLNLTILSEFLSKLMRLPVSFFDVKQFGEIMQRIGDHHRIESFLTGQTLSILFSLFNLFVFGFVLAYYHMPIFGIAVGASVLYAIWVTLFLRQRRKLDMKRFDVSSKNQSQLVQIIQGMQDIKLSGAETFKRWEWERTQASLFKWNIKNLSLTQFQQAGAILINQGKNIFITFLSAQAVIDGNLTLGGMMSIQYILGQFNAPIEQMISFIQSWQDAQLSLERLNEVHGLPDEEAPGEQSRKDWEQDQDLVLDKVSYTYPGAGNEPVLKDFSLTIPFGKTTAIVGTSGSGKTTLLKLLLRFYKPQNGSIALKGLFNERLDLQHISHKAWRQQCGVVMQEGFIFSDTIARNIAVCEEVIDQERLHKAAGMANIHEFINALPLGYHTKIGAEGNGISQGQKQRILIARSIYKDPQLLLFDEATNALDANNEAVIIRNLNEFFKGRTVIVVAHRLSTVKHADQIVVMEKGEIAELGTHAELVQAKGKYYELVSNQLELAV